MSNEPSERARIVAWLHAKADIALNDLPWVFRALARAIEAGEHWQEFPTELHVYTGFEKGETGSPSDGGDATRRKAPPSGA